MSDYADKDEAVEEFAGLWAAPDTAALHRFLILHPYARKSADWLLPLSLLRHHHQAEPECSLLTAVLLLTDRRWRLGAHHLVVRIAESGLLDDAALDALAETFLLPGPAVYIPVPDEWFAGGVAIEIPIEGADDDGADSDSAVSCHDLEDDELVVSRQITPPLRRWAASHWLARNPSRWPGLIAATDELNARHAAAIMAGVLDRIELLPEGAQDLIVARARTWPHHGVRRTAFEHILRREGARAAYEAARDDPNAKIRKWAGTTVANAVPTDSGTTEEDSIPKAAVLSEDVQSTLF